jgi:hypothetical protein
VYPWNYCGYLVKTRVLHSNDGLRSNTSLYIYIYIYIYIYTHIYIYIYTVWRVRNTCDRRSVVFKK